jgi:hypothetical protein
VVAALTMAGGGQAAESARYPDWKGAWERYVPPVSVVSPSGLRTPGGQPSFDQTKPWGRGQQAPLTLEYRLFAFFSGWI